MSNDPDQSSGSLKGTKFPLATNGIDKKKDKFICRIDFKQSEQRFKKNREFYYFFLCVLTALRQGSAYASAVIVSGSAGLIQ